MVGTPAMSVDVSLLINNTIWLNRKVYSVNLPKHNLGNKWNVAVVGLCVC